MAGGNLVVDPYQSARRDGGEDVDAFGRGGECNLIADPHVEGPRTTNGHLCHTDLAKGDFLAPQVLERCDSPREDWPVAVLGGESQVLGANPEQDVAFVERPRSEFHVNALGP